MARRSTWWRSAGRRCPRSPKSAVATLQLARLAAAGGGSKRVARVLLGDFSTRFAGDPCVPAAAVLAQQLDA
jgi:hypothetical protein